MKFLEVYRNEYPWGTLTEVLCFDGIKVRHLTLVNGSLSNDYDVRTVFKVKSDNPYIRKYGEKFPIPKEQIEQLMNS